METSSQPNSPSRFSDQASVPHGLISAEAGRSPIDEDADPDIQAHGHILNDSLLQAYNASQSHLIAVKKRLIEEKEIALMEAERNYLNQYDKFQNEIRELKAEIAFQEEHIARDQSDYTTISEKAATLLSKHNAKYSSPASLKRAFTAWTDEVNSTRQTDKLDIVARAFARKYLLAKTFLTMCLNSQRRKAFKANAEAKFKFDSVTTEMVTSYESQLEAMRADLKEAYVTIEAEQLRRQQLEEDLRRLFLKNMTAMNFEALSLFQNSHNMVESVHTKPIRSSVPAATPPRPVRRDLAPSPAVTRSGREKAPHHSAGNGAAASPPRSAANGLTEEEALMQQHLDAQMRQAALRSPAVFAPPAQARSPYAAEQYAEQPLAPKNGSVLRESYEPRPPLRSAGSSNSMDEFLTSGGYTSQLSDAYRGAVSSTSRLAHNVHSTPGSSAQAPPAPPRSASPIYGTPESVPGPTRRSPSQQQPSHAVSGGPRKSSGHSSSNGSSAVSTPASARKKAFH